MVQAGLGLLTCKHRRGWKRSGRDGLKIETRRQQEQARLDRRVAGDDAVAEGGEGNWTILVQRVADVELNTVADAAEIPGASAVAEIQIEGKFLLPQVRMRHIEDLRADRIHLDRVADGRSRAPAQR